MVLLSASHISYILSSGIICIFTFLLFLSGYVLQQQTVRSLQEALHAPPVPEPRATLPVRFQKLGVDNTYGEQIEREEQEEEDGVPSVSVKSGGFEESGREALETFLGKLPSEKENGEFVVLVDSEEEVEASGALGDEGEGKSSESVLLNMDTSEVEKDEATDKAETSIEPLSPTATPLDSLDSSKPSSNSTPESQPTRIAYALTLTQSQQICSALLFFRTLSNTTLRTTTPPIFLLLYPSSWETHPTPSTLSALTLMRTFADALPSPDQIIYHPVRTAEAWAGSDTHAQLLSELTRWGWGFDRLLWLRMPGVAVSGRVLEDVAGKQRLGREWIALSKAAKSRKTTRVGLEEWPVMLIDSKKGVVVPRGEVLDRLVGTVSVDEREMHGGQDGGPAYVLFDGEQNFGLHLDPGDAERDWRQDAWREWVRGTEEVCRGYSLDDANLQEEEKLDLKRGRIRGRGR